MGINIKRNKKDNRRMKMYGDNWSEISATTAFYILLLLRRFILLTIQNNFPFIFWPLRLALDRTDWKLLLDGCFYSCTRFVDIWKLCGYFFEKLLNIETHLGTDFLKRNIILLSYLPPLSFLHVPLLKIHLVCQKSDDDSITALRFDIIDPLLD